MITSTSQEYETSFGFTEEEVFYDRSHGSLPSHWERRRHCSVHCIADLLSILLIPQFL